MTDDFRVVKTFPLFDAPEQHAEAWRRMVAEATAWVRLGYHPNIVRAQRAVTIEGRLFIFTEYVSGGDLASRIGSIDLSY